MHDRSRLVAWNKLVLSKHNVRKVKCDPAPLAANIEVDGLIHPLVVIERYNGRFEVAAGERRRRAIGLLVRAGKWERTALVAVEVRSEEEATALSLAENVQRVVIHPADAFRAFAALAAEGHDEAAIANRHGYDGFAGWTTARPGCSPTAPRRCWTRPKANSSTGTASPALDGLPMPPVSIWWRIGSRRLSFGRGWAGALCLRP